MNGLEFAGVVTDRLRTEIPSRVVYDGAVPEGSIPPRYLVVWSSEGQEGSSRSTGTVHHQTPMVTVTSVSRNDDPVAASREARWGSARIREALRNWAPEGRWSVRSGYYQPGAQRDESISETTYYTAEQFTLLSYTTEREV